MTLDAAIWLVTAVLFALGLASCVLRRQLLAMLLGLELMIAAVNVALVHHAVGFGDVEALAAAAIFIAIAAAEAVVGLSLILRVHRRGAGLDAGELRELRG